MDGIASDKVNINVGGGEGSGGGGSMAAVIAALGNRNQGSDTAALIAALGNRNETHRVDDGGFGLGGGGGILGLLAILGLLRGRGGLGGEGGEACGETARTAILQTLMEGQSALRAEVPTTALQTQNALQAALASLALGTAQGFANTKDSIQNSTYLLSKELCDVNQNVSAQGCQTRDTVQNGITAVLSRIDQNRIAELEAKLARVESHGHARDTEINVTQNVSQMQQQQQQQTQLNSLFPLLHAVLAEQQIAKATNANLIIGSTGVATGPQTSNPVNVR